MKTITTLALALTLIWGSGCATAQRGAMLRAHSGIEKGKYQFALKRLNEAENYTKPTPQLMAEIAYLRGVCYAGLARPAEAKALFKYVVDHFPDTEYAYKAREQLTGEVTK
jgi:outer membrane protein assembly factor BamD (BamD/ComL family)